jgi:Sulfotransferase family
MSEPGADPIIVFGAPRSGTTYLQRILNAHPAVFVSHETRIFAWLHEALEVLPRDDRNLVTYRDAFVAHMRRILSEAVLSFYRELAPDAIRWGDKNPHYADARNAGCLELTSELFPEAQFIHIIRDGRDVVASLVRKRNDDGTPWVTFEQAHETWTSHVDVGSAFGRTLAPERYFELRYEKLIAADLALTRDLFSFLGLAVHPDVVTFVERQQASRTPFSGPTRDLSVDIGRSEWGNVFDEAQRARSLELIGEQLVRYGYETPASVVTLRAQPVVADA